MTASQMELFQFQSPTEASTSSPQDAPARTSRSPARGRGEKRGAGRAQASSSSLSALCARYGLDTSSTRTFPECLPRTREEISPTSSWRFGTAGMLSRGELWTRNMCEWTAWSVPSRRDGGVCGLSDVLEATSAAHLRYFLSERALRGIVRRAASRGKGLPSLLLRAMEWQLGWWARRGSTRSSRAG